MSHAPHSGESTGSLWNHDLAPTLPSQRTWTWYHFAALWIGMVMCIPAYTLAASMITNGMSWSQAVMTVFLGNLIVLIPMLLIACGFTPFRFIIDIDADKIATLISIVVVTVLNYILSKLLVFNKQKK